MAKKSITPSVFDAAEEIRLSPKDQGARLECHLHLRRKPPVRFVLTPSAAVNLMRALQHYQKKYKWPIPMVKIEPGAKV
jgi:hypothetical protein